MEKYEEKEMEFDSLVGRKVLSATINDKKDFIVLDTDKGVLYLTWVGDCCAQCFLAHVNGTCFLIGHTITKVENTEWRTVRGGRDKYDITEGLGTTIYTDIGTVTFESRVVHNGYYSGMINISDDEPMDQYHSPRYNWKEEKLSVLKDF